LAYTEPEFRIQVEWRMNTRIFQMVCIALLPFSVVHADIFKWVDAEGVTHFSDARPAVGTTPIVAEPVNIRQDYTESNPAEDYYSIVNQSKRMQAQRAEKDALALQKEQLRIDWYRAKQEALAAELDGAARLVEASQPLILVPGPYRHRPHPVNWTEPSFEVVTPPLLHQMNNLGLRKQQQQRPVKVETMQTSVVSLESESQPVGDN
jgi:hypothetical protein